MRQIKTTSWGIQANIATYAPEYECDECGWNILRHLNELSRDSRVEVMVGFDASVPGINRVGALVFECPNCYEKLWFHVTLESLALYMLKFKNWPNRPDD